MIGAKKSVWPAKKPLRENTLRSRKKLSGRAWERKITGGRKKPKERGPNVDARALSKLSQEGGGGGEMKEKKWEWYSLSRNNNTRYNLPQISNWRNMPKN